MKLQNISFNTSINFKNRSTSQKGAKKPDACTFYDKNNSYSYSQIEVTSHLKEADKLFDEFLERKGKVTPNEYLDILYNNPRLIIKAQDYFNKTNEENTQQEKEIRMGYWGCANCGNHITPEIGAKCALMLKDSFDEKFGKNNYRIISVGTSPAFATQIMPLMGTEVVFLPITGVRDFDINNNLHSFPKFMRLAHYLKKNGVNDDKKNVILDYTAHTGHTMKVVKKILTDLLELDDKNAQIVSLIPELKIANEKQKLLSDEKINDISDDLNRSRVEKFSNMTHYKPESIFAIDSETSDFEHFDNFSQKFGRAYALCAYNELYNLIN